MHKVGSGQGVRRGLWLQSLRGVLRGQQGSCRPSAVHGDSTGSGVDPCHQVSPKWPYFVVTAFSDHMVLPQ